MYNSDLSSLGGLLQVEGRLTGWCRDDLTPLIDIIEALKSAKLKKDGFKVSF